MAENPFTQVRKTINETKSDLDENVRPFLAYHTEKMLLAQTDILLLFLEALSIKYEKEMENGDKLQIPTK